MANSVVCLMDERDFEAIYSIYSYYVLYSVANFDYQPMSREAFKESLSHSFGVYVAKYEGRVIGYGYLHPAFSKDAYKYCAEITIYFEQGQHHGLAAKLMLELEKQARSMNMVWLISCITASNEASIAFHKKHGFELMGALPNCGYKDDSWHSVVWYCKSLKEEG